MTKEFIGDNNGNLTGLKTVNVSWEKDSNENYKLIEVEGSEKIWPCDLALLALGFTGPENLIFKDLKTEMNESSKPITNDSFAIVDIFLTIVLFSKSSIDVFSF